jgi:tetratricopeptide (TPR) repeat protein
MRRLLACLFALVTIPAAASAQFPPDSLKNLKVLPKNIPVRTLLDTMRTFAGALGVRCNFCHVGNEGEPLSKFDFASDKKPEKDIARTMMRMVLAINNDHLSKLKTRNDPPVVVGCATCHRGIAVPRPLQQVVLMAYDSGGADAGIAEYRALRQKYYGRASYDFGEGPLTEVGAALRARQKFADAVKFYLLNTEFAPNSPFAFRAAAEGQAAAGDTAAAIASLQHAMTLNPNDQQMKRMLDMLTHQAPAPADTLRRRP